MLSPASDTGLCTPNHVAIIMDGNGRWANARGLPRTMGHKAGLEAVRRVVRAAPELGVRTLTLYAFSSENWSRPPEEVRDLMGLLRLFVRRDLAELHANGVHIKVIGRRDNLQQDICNLIEDAEQKTAGNTKLTLNIAFNYGGRDEIARAVERIVQQRIASGVGANQPVTEDDISAYLDTANVADPDLIIRTSGEMRLSNFLPWQAAYAEFVFQPCLWPDYEKAHLQQAIAEFSRRDRRFGGVVETRVDVAL
ncbi:MAG: isoprenyl transferase [Ahrensia sp.]